MRFLLLSSLTLALSLTASLARAQATLEKFDWRKNSRFELRFTLKDTGYVIKDELRDGARQTYPTKDGLASVEIKSYTTELFTVIAITTEADDNGYIFLLERPKSDWFAMNAKPIKGRRLGLMDDFETAMKDFKSTTNWTLANSLRKTVEYFKVNPDKRLQDLLKALETRDEFLLKIPMTQPSPENGGVKPGEVPDRAEAAPAKPSAGRYNRPSGPPPDDDDEDEDEDAQAWSKRPRERSRPWRERPYEGRRRDMYNDWFGQ